MKNQSIFLGVLGAIIVAAIIFWAVKKYGKKTTSSTPSNTNTSTSTRTVVVAEIERR